MINPNNIKIINTFAFKAPDEAGNKFSAWYCGTNAGMTRKTFIMVFCR